MLRVQNGVDGEWRCTEDTSQGLILHPNEVNPQAPPGMDRRCLYGHPIPLSIKPSPSLSSRIILYHGTSLEGLKGILASGFARPTCKKRKECEEGVCKCHMMGRCFYFAGFGKAFRHAKKSSFWEEREQGAVIRVAIDPGRWRVQPKLPCSCPCKKPYVDHKGLWMQSFDGLFLEDNSLPAVRTNEWCIKSSTQIQVLDYQVYTFDQYMSNSFYLKK